VERNSDPIQPGSDGSSGSMEIKIMRLGILQALLIGFLLAVGWHLGQWLTRLAILGWIKILTPVVVNHGIQI
jgi:fatty acid desaturase